MGGGSKTTTTNQNEQATTTPQMPTYANDVVKNYFSGVQNYQQSDPYSFVTPANSLQTGAYQNAGGLFGANSLYGQAAAGAQGVLGATPATAQAQQTQAQAGTLGPAAQSTAQYAGPATQANASLAGPAAQVTAASAGQANQATAASLLDNFAAYQNPATQQLVNTTLADFDANSEAVRGQQAADAARNKGLSGSRFGFAQAATEGELARGRASTDANLRFNAFNTAAGLAGADADRRQATGLFNADAQNQYGLANAGFQQGANLFNAGATNDTARLNAQLGTQTNQFNAGAANDVNLANAQLGTQNNQFNTGQQNQYGLAQFGANNDMSQFNAGQANQLGQFNAGQRNDMQQAQLNRALQASGLLGDIAGQYGSNYRQDLAMQSDLGNQLYQMQGQQANAPLTQLQNIGALLGAGQLGTITGQTVTGQNSGVSQEKTSGGLFNSLLGLGNLGVSAAKAGIFSDRRLKTNIEQIGRMDNGLSVYTWDYLWGARGAGVMADEVAEIRPEALGASVGGFLTVNYEAL